MGFGILTDYREVTDINFAIKHNGFYKCEFETKTAPKHIQAVLCDMQKPFVLESVWADESDIEMNESSNIHYICSAVIKYLVDQGVAVTVSYGMYGGVSDTIEYKAQHMEKHLCRKAYYTHPSKFACS